MAKVMLSPTDSECVMYWDVATNTPNCFWVRSNHPCWEWNNDFENPTVSPSILNADDNGFRNHVFIRDGKIQYLSDCSHDMAGKTVDMVDFPQDW